MPFGSPERRPFLPRTQELRPDELAHSQERVPHPDEFRRFSESQDAPKRPRAPDRLSRLAAAALAFGSTSFSDRSDVDSVNVPVAQSSADKTQTVWDVWGTHQEPLRNHHKDEMARDGEMGRMARADDRRRYVWERTTKLINPDEVLERRDRRNERGEVVDTTITSHQERARTTLEIDISKPYADLLHAAATKQAQLLFEKSDTHIGSIGGLSAQEVVDIRVDQAILRAIQTATVEARERGIKGVNIHEGEYLVMSDFVRSMSAHFQRHPATMGETVAYFQAVLGRHGDLTEFAQSVETAQGRPVPNLRNGYMHSLIWREQFSALTDEARLEYLRDSVLASPASVCAALDVDGEWFVRHRDQLRQDPQIRTTMFHGLSSAIETSYREHDYNRAQSYERLLRYLQR